MKRNIFKKRVNIYPHEYPELLKFKEAIRHSYWTEDEYNFIPDVKDFDVELNDFERESVKRAMLAIAQIEVNVKTFWGKIYDKMPIDEISDVGATFSESEVRHKDAYAQLLRILGLEGEFEKVVENPVIKNRIKYLNKYTEYTKPKQTKLEKFVLENLLGLAYKFKFSSKITKKLSRMLNRDNIRFTKALVLFSIFVEHVSLFSQFFIIMSFNKYRALLKGMSNAVEATSKEEELHGSFGLKLINIIKEENPEWFDDKFERELEDLALKAFMAEADIVHWIFEKGDLSFCTTDDVLDFIADRFNRSFRAIGMKDIFGVNNVEKYDWFYEELSTTKEGDFFVKRETNYFKHSKPVTADDLF